MSNAEVLANMIDNVKNGKQKLFSEMKARGIKIVHVNNKSFCIQNTKPKVAFSHKKILHHFSNYPERGDFDMSAFLAFAHAENKTEAQNKAPKETFIVKSKK